MPTLARNEKLESIRYNYTPDERREKGQALADALNRLQVEESNLDRIKADFKAKMSTIEEEITVLKNSVLSGYELREYVCFWTFDQPDKGKKELRRKEPPQDVVRVEEMTPADRQTVMDEIEKQAAAEQPKGINPLSEKLDGVVVTFSAPGQTVPDVSPEAKAIADGSKAKAAKARAESRKGRRANQAGTVDVPSDAGSRDDAGDDSKNNL